MASARTVRPLSVLFLAVLTFGIVVAGALAVTALDDGSQSSGEIPGLLVEPRPQDNVVWPYTSARRSPSDAKLALNVVVHGNAEQVRWHLTEGAGATWNETTQAWSTPDTVEAPAGPRAVESSGVEGWAAARGADRYVYVHDYTLTERVNETARQAHRAVALRSAELNHTIGGQWVPETYQLHDGNYFGSRYHLRVFESPYESDRWVAIQAHSEHWDWFRLRHTVHGIDEAQERLESDLMGRWFVDEVWRMYFANDGGPNSDGWVTVADLEDFTATVFVDVGHLALGVLVLATVGVGRAGWRRGGRRHRRVARGLPRAATSDTATSWVVGLVETIGHRRFLMGLRVLGYAILFGSLFGLYLFVRATGIFLENQFPTLPPKLVAGSLYLLIAVGLPVCADRFGRAIPPGTSFTLAGAGIAAAMVLDYALLAITHLPLTIVVHRAGVAIALGLLAAGATPAATRTPRTNALFATGIVLWIALLVVPLLNLI